MKKIYVGNLSWSTSDDDLAAIFTEHGAVASAREREIAYERAKEQHARIEPTKVEARLLGRLGNGDCRHHQAGQGY